MTNGTGRVGFRRRLPEKRGRQNVALVHFQRVRYRPDPSVVSQIATHRGRVRVFRVDGRRGSVLMVSALVTEPVAFLTPGQSNHAARQRTRRSCVNKRVGEYYCFGRSPFDSSSRVLTFPSPSVENDYIFFSFSYSRRTFYQRLTAL